VIVARLSAKPRDLAHFLRKYGEDELAERVLSTATDEELDRIAVLAGHYAFSDVAMDHGGSMGGARALALAALDVLQPERSDLHRTRSEQELSWGLAPQSNEHDLERIRAVRSTAPTYEPNERALEQIREARRTAPQ
jgi:hypothetical protein